MWTIIKDKTQYNVAMERLLVLSERDLVENTPEFDEFELLCLLIKNYEDKKYNKVKIDPVRAIKFAMEQNNLTNKDLVKYLGAHSRVSEILNYKRKLTLSMIRKLHKGLGIPYELLINEYETQPTLLEQGYQCVKNFSTTLEQFASSLLQADTENITLQYQPVKLNN